MTDTDPRWTAEPFDPDVDVPPLGHDDQPDKDPPDLEPEAT